MIYIALATHIKILKSTHIKAQPRMLQQLVTTMIRDVHILFKVPIMLCSDSQHQANYAHHFAPIMLTINTILHINT